MILRRITANFRRQPPVIASSAAVLSGDPQFLQFLRRRIAEVSTHQANLIASAIGFVPGDAHD